MKMTLFSPGRVYPFRAAIALAMALGVCGSVQGMTIVDTGASLNPLSGWGLVPGQWLAGAFTVDSALTITGIEGLMRGIDGEVTIALYNDSASFPSTELYAATFQGGGATDWRGASGLNWSVAPGTYWASFEVRAGSTFGGVMPGHASNPLLHEAVRSGGNWLAVDNLDLGIRIHGELTGSTNVPDRGPTFGLVALCLLGICLVSSARRPLTPARVEP
jgi:hypothetical protein